MLSKLRKAFGNEKVKSLPHYRAIFIAVFIAAEVATISIEAYYLWMGQKTVTSFLLDSLLFTAIAGILLLVAYYLVGRVLSVYIEQHGKFEDMVNNSADTIYYLDNCGCIDWVNDAGLDAFGCGELKQVRGKPFADFIHPDDREMVFAYFDDALKMRRATTSGLTFRMVKKDGDDLYVELQAHTVFDEEGNHMETVGIIRDVTTRKRYEEALERANAQLEGYAHTAAHDLKNPISNVVFGCGALQNLLDLPLTDQNITYIKEVADVIINGSVKAAALIDELPLLAESGQVPKEIENVDVDEEVRLIIADKSLQADGVRFNTNDLGTVVASPTHIYQIFSNLISNAVRFTNGDESRIDILRLPSEEGSVHRFLVKDNGPGIPEEIMDKIFILFTKDKEKGETGIGLSIVERMVKVYGGDIRAYNDNGACFEFTLKDFTYQAS